MSKRFHLVLHSHHDALHLLGKSKKKNFDIILNNTPNILKAIRILFQYILKDRFKMKSKHRKILKKHRTMIRKIAQGSDNSTKLAIQHGGSIFKTILNTVLPLLTALI